MCCCTNKSEKFQGEAKDPVCGMMVDPAKASASQYGGVTYSFCCGDANARLTALPITTQP